MARLRSALTPASTVVERLEFELALALSSGIAEAELVELQLDLVDVLLLGLHRGIELGLGLDALVERLLDLELVLGDDVVKTLLDALDLFLVGLLEGS
jgi:hypothetical protein